MAGREVAGFRWGLNLELPMRASTIVEGMQRHVCNALNSSKQNIIKIVASRSGKLYRNQDTLACVMTCWIMVHYDKLHTSALYGFAIVLMKHVRVFCFLCHLYRRSILGFSLEGSHVNPYHCIACQSFSLSLYCMSILIVSWRIWSSTLGLHRSSPRSRNPRLSWSVAAFLKRCPLDARSCSWIWAASPVHLMMEPWHGWTCGTPMKICKWVSQRMTKMVCEAHCRMFWGMIVFPILIMDVMQWQLNNPASLDR